MASIKELAIGLLLLWRSSSYSCGQRLNVDFYDDQFYSEFAITLDGEPWFTQKTSELSHIFATKEGETFSTSDQSLRCVSGEEAQGFDSLGSFASYGTHWIPAHLGYETRLRVYNEEPLIVFTQRFQKALNGTNLRGSAAAAAYDRVSTCFPSLAVLGEKLGHISFGGNMAGWAALSVASTASNPDSIRRGQLGGPVVFFNQDYSGVVVLSALNNFMVVNLGIVSGAAADNVLNFGLMGSIESIPNDGTEIEFVLAAGRTFDEAFTRWGNALRKYHGKEAAIERDVARKYLGYWTDNGAYYYYKTLPNATYEDTLIGLFEQFKEQELPIKYVEIDSWWYFKGPSSGVTNWTAIPELFPNGLDHVQQLTGWPVAAHNRYWSGLTDYAKSNGGQYDFIIESDGRNRSMALPQDQQFWDDLFHEGKKWGLEMYEQDWLDIQFLLMSITHTDFDAARNWLLQMGKGAARNNILIKYCMGLPRTMLTSVEIEAVNAARTSGDYRLSRDNWRIGVSSYLSSALGLATFKDTFWSSETNSDHPFYYDCMITTEEADPNLPWEVSYRYDGLRSVTLSGKECVSWYDLDFHFTVPNYDLERNACRNVKAFVPQWGEGKPWCFTNASLNIHPDLWEWESCDIPICGQDCRRGVGNGDDSGLPECHLMREPNPMRQAVVSLISRGGVGPGDRIDNVDYDVVMRTCRQDGRLLVPDKPALAAPIQMLHMAFSGTHNPMVPHSFEIGEIWTTWTTLNDRYVFPLIFLSETTDVGVVSWSKLGLDDANLQTSENYVIFYHGGALLGGISDLKKIQLGDPIAIPDIGVDKMELLHMSPLWTLNGSQVALLGELGKYVTVSKERIKGLHLSVAAGGESTISLDIEGSPGEQVTMAFALVDYFGVKDVIECSMQIGQSGDARISFSPHHDPHC